VNDPRNSGFMSSGLNGRTLDSTMLHETAMLMQSENSNVQNVSNIQNAPQITSQNVAKNAVQNMQITQTTSPVVT
jgi:hypothetical protein